MNEAGNLACVIVSNVVSGCALLWGHLRRASPRSVAGPQARHPRTCSRVATRGQAFVAMLRVTLNSKTFRHFLGW